MNGKRYILITFLTIFFFLLLNSSLAGKRFNIDDPHAKYGGLTLIQTDRGSGLGGFFEWSINTSNRIGINASLLMIKGKYDYPIIIPYDPYNPSYGYSYYEKSDKKRLSLLPVYINYKRVLFTDAIANNFRPFLNISFGPVIAFDPPNVPDFVERWKKMTTAYTFGGRIGTGVDFLYGPGTIITLYFGYDYIHFLRKIDASKNYEMPEGYEVPKDHDGLKDYSGLILKIGFGKKY